jgi:endonuclease YncB( thermonuclease family)
MKSITALLFLATVTVATSFTSGDSWAGRRGGSSASSYKPYKGAKAIDGDTFRYRGDRYRIQQYNAPELGRPGARAATRSLQNKIDSGSHEWKPVARDAYGRKIVRERPSN